MAEKINQIEINGTTYDLQDKDAKAPFIGTRAEVDAAIANGTIKDGDIVNITDDVLGYTVADSYEEIIANTQAGIGAGALGVKEGFTKVNESLGGVSAEITSMTLVQALTYMCDNYMKNNLTSYNGRFACANGWFSYSGYYAGGWWSGYITGVTQNESYSFYRQAGADAVLKKLGSGTLKKVTIQSGSFALNGGTTSINISSVIPNYADLNLTVDNFALTSVGTTGNCTANSGGTLSISSYSDGVLVVGCGGWGHKTSTVSGTVCCIYSE